MTDGVDAYNVYFAGFPAGQVCMGGNFAVSAGDQAAYDACYADSWTANCDSIGDPPGEGSMYVVAVGPLLTHSDVNLNGASFAREVIADVTAGDGNVTVDGSLTCGGAVSGTTLDSDVSNLGRAETAEKVYSWSFAGTGMISLSSCGSAELFDTTLSVYAVTSGTPAAPDATTVAITMGGVAMTATRVAYHDGTGSSCGHLAEIMDLWLSAGDYLIAIDGWPNGNAAQRHGDFAISMACTPDGPPADYESSCRADVTGSARAGDGRVDVQDLLQILTLMDCSEAESSRCAEYADVSGSSGSSPDGAVNVHDLLFVLSMFNSLCPQRSGRFSTWLDGQTVAGRTLLEVSAGPPLACDAYAIAGAMYFDTSLGTMLVCRSSAWQAPYDFAGAQMVCEDGWVGEACDVRG